MVVMLIVLVALGTIAGLTVISVQGGSAQASTQRFSAMALYAAESGAAAAMSWLRTQYSDADHFTPVLGQSPEALPGNGVHPGERGNLLSDDQQGWYEVTLLNNPNDPGGRNSDTDSIVVIQVTGHGPSGAMRRLEWEVHRDDAVNALAIIGWRDLF
jgi:type II secretory pathway pseudopilin PulG